MDLSKPAYLQGIYEFSGSGLTQPTALDQASYTVPYDKRAQLIYFRAGNSSDSLINIVLVRDGEAMRYFPIGAKSTEHVSLAVVEDIAPDSVIELHVAAADKVSGTIVVDIGFVEI